MRARPPSRAFWKRLEGRWSKERGGATGGAKGGAQLHKGRTRIGRGVLRLLPLLQLRPLAVASTSCGFDLWQLLPLFGFFVSVPCFFSFGSFSFWISLFSCWFWSCARGLAGGLSTEARTEDAEAPVLWRICAFGRGVPERARRPQEESGPGATTPTVVGGGLDGPKGSHHFLFGVLYGCCGAASL